MATDLSDTAAVIALGGELRKAGIRSANTPYPPRRHATTRGQAAAPDRAVVGLTHHQHEEKGHMPTLNHTPTVGPIAHGVIPPIVTPLDSAGELDEVSLRRLVDFEIDASVSGLFALGTGGEGPWTTASTRRRVLEVVVDQTAGRVPVFAGVSDVGTARVIEAVRDAEATGCTAIVATSAFFGDNGQAEILAHFRAIAAATTLPLLAYDIPSKVAHKILPETISTLAHEGTIVGVKDSSGNEDQFREVLTLTQDLPAFAVITGSDLIADAALFQGADGMIVGMGNIDPHAFVRLYEAYQRGDYDTARAEQVRLRRLRSIITIGYPRIGSFSATIAAFKAAMVERNIIANDTMHAPLLSLTSAEREQVRTVLADLDVKPAFTSPPRAEVLV
jgi:4-hydroxy-tetrahydrodipicolinate synthase